MKIMFRPLRYISATLGLLVMAVFGVLSFVGAADDIRSASDPAWWQQLIAEVLSLPGWVFLGGFVAFLGSGLIASK